MKINNLDDNKKKTLYEIIKYSGEKNQYYHNLFSQFNVDMSESVEDIYKNIPITSKENFRKKHFEFFSDTEEMYIQEFTSGSTGIPLECIKTKSERVKAGLALWRKRKSIDKYVNVNNFVSVWQDKKIRNNFIHLGKVELIDMLIYIINKKPRWLSGPISVIELYAKLIEEGCVDYNNSIQVIEFIGEYVDSHRREYIERIFQCRTVILYGTREVWGIAYECEHKHLHVIDDMVFVDIVDKDGNSTDEEGEVVVTSLYNKKMPFIKYNTNDLGLIKKTTCKCGLNSPIIELKGGRVMDIIKGYNVLGNVFFGRISDFLAKKYPKSIEAFKVEQIEMNYFKYYIVQGKKYGKELEKKATELIKKELGENIIIEYIYLEKIPLSSNGKRKVFETFVN